MNKAELIKALANRVNQTQVEAKVFFDRFMDVVRDVLKSGDNPQ